MIIWITSVLCINLLLIYIFKLVIEKGSQKVNKQYKNSLNSLLALNTSHLHDAANFFALIKNQTKDSNIYNFAKGASFHFRSLFDELYQANKSLSDEDKDLLQSLYQKEAIDLKDILELELLQLSNNGRLEILNNCTTEHALIEGNFSLLSKVILNLVENALKYTGEQVKIELNDNDNKWQIKISSFGKSIPDELAAAINEDSGLALSTGHGLASLQPVMQFHQAQAVIDTLAGEGTSIRLIFDKYNRTTMTTQISKDAKQSFSLANQLFVFFSFVLIVVSLIFTINYNKAICEDYYQKTIDKPVAVNIIHKEQLCKQALTKLEESFSFESTETYRLIEDKLLSRFEDDDKELVSLILFEHLLIDVPLGYKQLVNKRAKSLIVEFPDSIVLNRYLSNFYLNKKYYGRMMIHSLKYILAIAESKLYIHPELYLSDVVGDDTGTISKFLAKLYLEPEAPVMELKEEPLILPREIKPILEPTQEFELPEEQGADLDEIDGMINELDAELGLEIENF